MPQPVDLALLLDHMREWSRELGFQQLTVGGVELPAAEARLQDWLARGYHGEMHYMARHGLKRSRPPLLVPNTVRVLSLRMDYLPPDTQPVELLQSPEKAYISRYALGRDYHKLVRKRLASLVGRVQSTLAEAGQSAAFRVFADSAPVLEKAAAAASGMGWIGKNTLLLNRSAGSWFFLGDIYTDLPLPLDNAGQDHCGSCEACLAVCPTQALVAPYVLDARRCISYLTIEHKGAIPESMRPLLGNRIFGCDDCQLVCPWNRFARHTGEGDFAPRHGLDSISLLDLLNWSEDEFLQRSEGSAIRRCGFSGWQRNIAVALGNSPPSAAIISALLRVKRTANDLVAEHLTWAVNRQRQQSVG